MTDFGIGAGGWSNGMGRVFVDPDDPFWAQPGDPAAPAPAPDEGGAPPSGYDPFAGLGTAPILLTYVPPPGDDGVYVDAEIAAEGSVVPPLDYERSLMTPDQLAFEDMIRSQREPSSEADFNSLGSGHAAFGAGPSGFGYDLAKTTTILGPDGAFYKIPNEELPRFEQQLNDAGITTALTPAPNGSTSTPAPSTKTSTPRWSRRAGRVLPAASIGAVCGRKSPTRHPSEILRRLWTRRSLLRTLPPASRSGRAENAQRSRGSKS